MASICFMPLLTKSPSLDKPKADIAIAARIYTSPSSKRKSHLALYLCGIHGEHLHRLTQPSGDVILVRWKDANHLQWLSTDPKKNSSNMEQGQLDLSSGQVVRTQVQTIDGAIWHASEVQFRAEQKSYDSMDPKHPGRFGFTEDQQAWVYRSNGKEQTFPTSDGSPHGIVFDGMTNRLWTIQWTHSPDGSHFGLSRFDWTKHKLIPIFEEAESFDFNPNRPLYAAVATRGLADYPGKRTVWVAKAWVGEWESGKRWTMLDGLAYATSIAIRPSAALKTSAAKTAPSAGR